MCACVVGVRFELIQFFVWIGKAFYSVCEHLWSLFLSLSLSLSHFCCFIFGIWNLRKLYRFRFCIVFFWHFSEFSPLFWFFPFCLIVESHGERGSHSQNNCCIAFLRKKNFKWNLCFYLSQINPPSPINEFRTNEMKTWKNLCSFRLFSNIFFCLIPNNLREKTYPNQCAVIYIVKIWYCKQIDGHEILIK